MEREVIREKDAQLEVASALPKIFYKSNNCYRKIEEYTNLNNRADILIVFRGDNSTPYTIVVEVKSRTTQDHLKPSYDYKKGNILGQVIVTVIISILVAYFGTIIIEVNWLQSILYISIFLLATHIINNLSKNINLDAVQSMKVMQQLDKYDANEKWIAIPHDTFVDGNNFNVIEKACRKKGVGLIILEEDFDLNFVCNPKPILETNTFLNSYKNSESIYEQVSELERYRGSPNIIIKVFRQSAYILSIIIGFILMFGMFSGSNNIKSISDSAIDSSSFKMDDDSSVLIFKEPKSYNLPELKESDRSEVGIQSCDHFREAFGYFIVVDRIYKNRLKAINRLSTLRESGLVSLAIIPSSCFNNYLGVGHYIVHTNALYTSQQEATRATLELKNHEISYGIETAYLKPMLIK